MTEVYLGSSFSLTERVERVHEALLENGHYVTDMWWDNAALSNEHPAAGTDAYYRLPEVEEMARRHFHHLRRCEAFVLVADEDPRRYNGANIELGYAIAQGVPTFAYGSLQRSAMYHPVGRFDELGSLIEALNGVDDA